MSYFDLKPTEVVRKASEELQKLDPSYKLLVDSHSETLIKVVMRTRSDHKMRSKLKHVGEGNGSRDPNDPPDGKLYFCYTVKKTFLSILTYFCWQVA